MKLDEYIDKSAREIINSLTKGDALNVTRSIIEEINNLKYNNNNLLSCKDKQYIIAGIKRKTVQVRILRKSQESEMFLKSIDAIKDLIVEELDTELRKSQEESKDGDD